MAQGLEISLEGGRQRTTIDSLLSAWLWLLGFQDTQRPLCRLERWEAAKRSGGNLGFRV